MTAPIAVTACNRTAASEQASATHPPHIDHIVVINDLSRPIGGASALAVQSAIGFARAGYRVTFLAGDAAPAPGPGNQDADHLGFDHQGFDHLGFDHQGLAHAAITVIGLGQARLLARSRGDALISGWWNRAALAMVREFVGAHDTPGTIYHVHGWSQILSPAIFAALAPVRDRIVVSAHDFFLVCPNGAYADMTTGAPCTRVPLGAACCLAGCDRRGRAHKVWRVVRSMIQRRALASGSHPAILAIHEAMIPALRRGGIAPAAIAVLPNPVVPWAATRITAEHNREVLFVGRLEHTKGADLALAAARAAGVAIRIIGDGAMAAQLRTDYPEAQFAGRLPPRQIAMFARQARLLIMPSRYPEPFGLVAMEALRSGVPVVLPPSALLADAIVDLGAGMAVDPRDTLALADVLRTVSHDDRIVQRMSEAAFAHSRALVLDPADWLDRLAGIYRNRLASATIKQVISCQAAHAVARE